MNNAVKYTSRGEIRLAAAAEGEEVKLFVEDTGRGIPPAEGYRIFGPFERLDDLTPGVPTEGGTAPDHASFSVDLSVLRSRALRIHTVRSVITVSGTTKIAMTELKRGSVSCSAEARSRYVTYAM